MAFSTTTTVEARSGNEFRPNVRPEGIEQSPDPKWRAWRLREQRPEIRETLPPTFPNINHLLCEQDLEKIKQDSGPGAIRDLSSFEPRLLQDLKGHKPIRLKFRPMSEVWSEYDQERQRLYPRRIFREDEDDALPPTWLTQMTESLFARVWEFCADTFGRECFGGQVDERNWTDFILRRLPAGFIKCASEVARGDPARHPKLDDPHSYEHLFLAKNERTFLMIGTISKLLELNVFNSLLFGADTYEAKELNLQDRTTLHTDDGYQRNLARTNLVRQYFKTGRDLEPSRFWEEVDGVTMGILDLLLPMIKFLGCMSPRTAWPSLTEVHQNLHNIVAEAAKLTNGMRVCRAVCWINYPLTGDLWAINHEHTSSLIYDESTRRTLELDAKAAGLVSQLRDWQKRRTEAQEAVRRHFPGQDREAYVQQWERRNPVPVDRSMRTAKVQIVLWPSFTSHFPIRQNAASGGGYNAGEERRTNIKAQVVYYSGIRTDAGDQYEDFTLLQHIQSRGGLIKQRENRWLTHLIHQGPYECRLLGCLLVILLLSFLWSSVSLSRWCQWSIRGSPAAVEITQTQKTLATPYFTAAPSTVSTETSEPAKTRCSSPTCGMEQGFGPQFFSEKESSDMKATASETSSTIVAVHVITEPEAVTDVTTLSTTSAAIIELEKLTPSKKIKAVKKEDAIAQPVSAIKTESVERPASVSSPWSLLKRASQATNSGSWLDYLDLRHFWDSAGSSIHSTADSSSQHAPTTVDKETSVSPDHPIQLAITKVDEVTAIIEETTQTSVTIVDKEINVLFKEPVGSSATTIREEITVLPQKPAQPSVTTNGADPVVSFSGLTQTAAAVIENLTTILHEKYSSSEATIVSEADKDLAQSPIMTTEEVPGASIAIRRPPASQIITDAATILSQNPSSSNSVLPSEVGEAANAPYFEQTSQASLPVSDDNTQPIHSSIPQMKMFESTISSGSKIPVIQALGPKQVTMTGAPAEASSTPTTTQGWNIEYADVATTISRWTNTRVKTYTGKDGRVSTVSEIMPRSKETYESVAAWHRSQRFGPESEPEETPRSEQKS